MQILGSITIPKNIETKSIFLTKILNLILLITHKIINSDNIRYAIYAGLLAWICFAIINFTFNLTLTHKDELLIAIIIARNFLHTGVELVFYINFYIKKYFKIFKSKFNKILRYSSSLT